MEICDLNALEMTRLLRKRDVSAAEIVESCLTRIATVDGRAGVLDSGEISAEDKKWVHAFITLTANEARTQAAEVDKKLSAGEDPGPLAGVPFTVKDIFCVRGTFSTAASRILANFKAPYTATPVQRMQDAGAIVLGKTNMPPWGGQFFTDNALYGQLEQAILGRPRVAGAAVRFEAPDADGRRHFVELSEMYAGEWLAHASGATRLEAVESSGGDFDWEYGKPYRLVVELKPGLVRGTVAEADGTVRASLAFALGERAVNWGRPGVTAGDFRAEFRDFSAGVGMKVSTASGFRTGMRITSAI